MKVDVVIIGSGVSGLTAGTLLAKNGKKIAVIEQQRRPGGAIRQFRRRKISFDVGFHYTGCLGPGEILDRLWHYCGVLSDIPVIPLGQEGYDHFEFDGSDQTIKGYFSYERFEEELNRLFPHERQGITTYFQTVRDICAEVPFYDTSLPLIEFLRGYKSRPSLLTCFLDDHVHDRNLRSVLTAPAFLYGVPISQASLEVHALVAHGYYTNAYTVQGGGQSIVNSFLSALERYGAELVTECRVATVEVNQGSVSGVRTDDGRLIECSDVIYTGHPAHVIGMVPESVFRPAYRKRLLGLKNSLSMFAVFGESEQPLEFQRGPLNHYLLPGTGEILKEYNDDPPGSRPMMMTASRGEVPDALQSDLNGIILLRLGYWKDVECFEKSSPEDRPAGYEAYKNEIAAEMIRTAEARWGDLCGSIEPLAVGTPLTFRDELAAPEGCAYGAMHCVDQFNPEVRTRLPGLYLCGQSTLMTGVAGSSISGIVGAGEILGLEPLWEDLTK